jgi:hypothetical protein
MSMPRCHGLVMTFRIHGKIGWSRLLRIVYRDRAAARRSIDAIIAHDFDRIVIAHGDVIRRDGRAALRRTFDFLGVVRTAS